MNLCDSDVAPHGPPHPVGSDAGLGPPLDAGGGIRQGHGQSKVGKKEQRHGCTKIRISLFFTGIFMKQNRPEKERRVEGCKMHFLVRPFQSQSMIKYMPIEQAISLQLETKIERLTVVKCCKNAPSFYCLLGKCRVHAIGHCFLSRPYRRNHPQRVCKLRKSKALPVGPA